MIHKQKAFTLMELMIVVAIIMLLAGAITIRLSKGTEGAKIAKATKEAQEIATAIKAFYMDTGYWPDNINALSNSADSGLLTNPKALGKDVRDDQGNKIDPSNLDNFYWNGPYLETETLPKDPWEVAYYKVYNNGKALVVCSLGPDIEWQSESSTAEGKASGDDIVILVNIYEED